MKKDDIEDFMDNIKDFGKEPAERALTENEKKLAALAMGMNAAIVQFINEGIIPLEEQIHFMLHLQDFTARIYNGEDLKIPRTNQTLQINSKAGNLFLEAAEEALINGHKNYKSINEKLKALEPNIEKEHENVTEDKRTLH
jgi:hypothetical protein